MAPVESSSNAPEPRDPLPGWLCAPLEALLLALLPARGERRDGARHGAWVVRLPGGRVLEQTTWERGQRHGPQTRHYLSGRKRWVGAWKQGRREGEWFFFRRDGRMDAERTGNYQDGLRWSGIKGFNDWNT